MKKEFPIIISTLALIISIIALCNAYPRQLNFDYLGFLIGIIGLLTTILIGWQIYTVIDINRIRKDISTKNANLSLAVQNSLAEVQMTAFLIYFYKPNRTNDDNYQLWLHGIHSLLHLSHAGDYQAASSVAQQLIHESEQLKDNHWSKGNLEVLIDTFLQLHNPCKIPEYHTLLGILCNYKNNS